MYFPFSKASPLTAACAEAESALEETMLAEALLALATDALADVEADVEDALEEAVEVDAEEADPPEEQPITIAKIDAASTAAATLETRFITKASLPCPCRISPASE